MKIDLHCHSKHSNVPNLWVMKKLNCPESFTEPIAIYHRLRERGMSAVTITDHDTIAGALEIAHLPGAFTGCEYTTHFPDRCKVHILVYGQSEAQHADLMHARKNIFDLVAYCQQHALPVVCAHPFFWVNDRLTMAHIEQLVLLFRTWEINGDISTAMNNAVLRLVQQLTPAHIERLADMHGIAPAGPDMWKKHIVAGSDCHSGLNLAAAYTKVAGAPSLEEFWRGVDEGQAKTVCPGGTPEAFARNVYSVAYQFYKNRVDLDRYVQKDVFLNFLERALIMQPEGGLAAMPWYHVLLSRRRSRQTRQLGEHSLFQIARNESEKLIHGDPQLMAIVRDGNTHGSDLDQKWFDFANQVSNRMLVHFGNHMLDRLTGAHLFDLFHTIGSAGALGATLAPYFIAFSLHRQERLWSEEVLAHFGAPGTAGAPRVAHFTDTLNEVNGVARTLRQNLAMAQELGRDYTIVTCFPERTPFQRGVVQFTPVGVCELPEYPELKVLTPPFLQMLKHCHEEGVTHLHAATPGPVGLAALGIARILKLPISGTYHTAIPQYGKALTGDTYVEDLLWKGMIWFYEQLDAIYVPSLATAQDLLEHGLNPEKIRVYPRGIDVDRFHPAKRNGIYADRFGITDDRVNILFVGRVSPEKNLPLLAEAFRRLVEQGLPARLVIAGDGPYRPEMEAALAGLPVLFTGYLEGDELATLYASSDVFAFPSTTDTFGNVVLEAQAAGIPVVVSDRGGPQENLVPDRTGLVVPADNADALAAALAALVTDGDRRRAMGHEARMYMANRGFKAAFARLYEMYVDEDAPSAGQPPGEPDGFMQAMTAPFARMAS